MLKLVVFCVLLMTCWPLGLLALFVYLLVRLALLPFRLLGSVVGGIFHLMESIFRHGEAAAVRR